MNRIQNRYKYGDQGINRHHIRTIKAYYYACISYVDYQIGRSLDARLGKSRWSTPTFLAACGLADTPMRTHTLDGIDLLPTLVPMYYGP